MRTDLYSFSQLDCGKFFVESRAERGSQQKIWFWFCGSSYISVADDNESQMKLIIKNMVYQLCFNR